MAGATAVQWPAPIRGVITGQLPAQIGEAPRQVSTGCAVAVSVALPATQFEHAPRFTFGCRELRLDWQPFSHPRFRRTCRRRKGFQRSSRHKNRVRELAWQMALVKGDR